MAALKASEIHVAGQFPEPGMMPPAVNWYYSSRN
jgi:hypothetical protein